VYSSGIPVTAVGLDVTMQCHLSAQDLDRIASSQLPTVHFLDQSSRSGRMATRTGHPILHDPLAIGVTLRPDLVRTRTGRVEVELRGDPKLTYGMDDLSRGRRRHGAGGQEVESERFVRLFMERVDGAPARALAQLGGTRTRACRSRLFSTPLRTPPDRASARVPTRHARVRAPPREVSGLRRGGLTSASAGFVVDWAAMLQGSIVIVWRNAPPGEVHISGAAWRPGR